MPANKFLGIPFKTLIELRTACQMARMTGVATKVNIAGVDVEYDPSKMPHLNVTLDEIQYAISQHENADPDDPTHANPYHQRPGRTQVSMA